jgi:hypothetical protein
MLLALVTALILVSVPLTGGRLSRVADVRLRASWALFAALGIQVVILEVLPGGVRGLHAGAHVVSYLLAAYFVVVNLRVPGMVLMGLGGALNAAAIFANGGVMPASPAALRTAGIPLTHDGFVNSAAAPGAHLRFLGDVFAVPASWPASNVFSIGDVCLAVGLAVGLHLVCRQRPATSSRKRASSRSVARSSSSRA